MTTTAYDRKTYPYAIRAATHVGRLGAIAQLFGRAVAPLEDCRVLEIGGGDAINLIAMALSAPRSQFLSFDFAETATQMGRDLVAATGVHNVRLETWDVCAIPEDIGTFDYVIAHGFYAWVPEPARRAMMALIGRVLTPRGVAMVSYNTLPGCHIRSVLRDLLIDAVGTITDPEEKMRAVRETLTFHIAHWNEKDLFQRLLIEETKELLERPDGVIFHDELGATYVPQLVSHFAAAAASEGLAYLGDMQLAQVADTLWPGALYEESRARHGGDWLRYKQIKDFADARAFSSTLLCRADGPIERGFVAERVRDLYAHGRFEPKGVGKEGETIFGIPRGGTVAIKDPSLIAAFERLSRAYPDSVRVGDLSEEPAIWTAIARLFVAVALELTTNRFPLGAGDDEKPRGARLARVQAARGEQEVASLRHTKASLDNDSGRVFLTLLDGTRTRADLAAEMARVQKIGLDDAAAQVRNGLEQFAAMGLMEGAPA